MIQNILRSIWFTSDTHYGHANICRGTSKWKEIDKTRDFLALDDMNTAIVNGINDYVGEHDILYHLGDWSFGGIDRIWEFRDRLNVKDIRLVIGNHDHHIERNRTLLMGSNVIEAQKLFTSVKLMDYAVFFKKAFIMCHYPIRSWNGMGKGYIHTYGHCMDINTEILTAAGWKNYLNISKYDKVYSLTNVGESTLALNNINKIIINTNINKVNIYDKRLSMAVTDDHRIFTDNSILLCKDILQKHRVKIPLCGLIANKGIDLSDNLLRLYIYLAADGSVNLKTSLGRLMVLKKRKVELFEKLLNALNIKYSKNKQKDNSICFNFKIPTEILEFNIKGLDVKLLNCSEKQVDLIVKSYTETDGYINQNKYPIIFTSKESERDILSALGVLNGYSVSIYTRMHGFSKKEKYSLNFNKNKEYVQIQPKTFFKQIIPDKNITWCINTDLGNFICRRNGKIHITGNCHSDIEHEPIGKSMDVGIDNAFKLFGEYRPFNVQEIIELMSNRKILKIGHHG